MKKLKNLSLIQEARKYKTAEDFIQSIRLPLIIKEDTERLNKLNSYSKEKAIKLYDNLENFNKSKKIIQRNLKSEIAELKKINIPKNKLGENCINLLPKKNGWFYEAENLWKKSQEI